MVLYDGAASVLPAGPLPQFSHCFESDLLYPYTMSLLLYASSSEDPEVVFKGRLRS